MSTSVFSGVCGILFAACNGPFVSVWTHGRFSWPEMNNVLLALWMIVSAQQCCHNSLIMNLKEIRGLKYLFIIEGIAFVGLSVAVLPSRGLTGMLACSLAATMVFTWLSGVWRIASLSEMGWIPVLWEWQKPLFWVLGVMVPCWLVIHWILIGTPDWLRLLVNGGMLSIIGAWTALRLALPCDLINDFAGRLPQVFQRIVVILGKPAAGKSRPGCRPISVASSSKAFTLNCRFNMPEIISMLPSSGAPLVACTGGLMLGGSTTFLLNLGKSFRQAGLALHLVTMKDEAEMAAEFASAGIPVHAMHQRGRIYEDRIRFSYLETARLRPKAVLSCLGTDSFELLRLVPKGTVRLGIIQSDDPGPYRMTRHYAPWLDAIVGVSQRICENLKSDPAFASVRVEHIPYGINFGPPVHRPARDVARPIKLIYVGRVIEEQKRISRVIELSRMLDARGVSFELTIVGRGPELEKTKESLKDLHAVRFRGEVPNAEVSALLRAQDVFVLLSDYEGLPLSLLEAMGEGVVPVISDLKSGTGDVVTERNGLKVKVGDVAAAADAIISLAGSPARLAEISASASELARGEYSSARMAERYLSLIGSLAKTQAPWPADVEVYPPLMLPHPWLYRGLARRARRLWRRIRPA